MTHLGLPAPSCSRSLCPGCAQHTPTAKSAKGRNTGPRSSHAGRQSHGGAELQAPPRRQGQGHFPTDDTALKLLFLVLNRSQKAWTMPLREWAMAKAQVAVLFGVRFTRAMA